MQKIGTVVVAVLASALAGVVSLVPSKFRKLGLAALVACLGFGAQAQSGYSIVSTDTNGVITFTPMVIIIVLIGAVVAAATGAASIVLLWIGIKWLYKILHGSR